MRRKTVYSQRADADLERLEAFIARKNPHSAKRAVQRIIEGIDLLALFPRSGVVVKGASQHNADAQD